MKILLLLLTVVLFAGCGHETTPAKHTYDLPGIAASLGTSEPTKGSDVSVEVEYDPATGNLLRAKMKSKDSGISFAPNMDGENWTMYAGIGLLVLGGVSFFIPGVNLYAKWILGGGAALLFVGSYLKHWAAPWVTGFILVTGLIYLVIRLAGGFKKVLSVTESRPDVKAEVHHRTTHGEDRIIDALKPS